MVTRLKWDYRHDRIQTIPHYSILQKAAKHPRDIISQRLLAVMAIYTNHGNMTIPVDSTGFATEHTTFYRICLQSGMVIYEGDRSYAMYIHLIIARVTVQSPMNDARISKNSRKDKTTQNKNIPLDKGYDLETIRERICDCNIKWMIAAKTFQSKKQKASTEK